MEGVKGWVARILDFLFSRIFFGIFLVAFSVAGTFFYQSIGRKIEVATDNTVWEAKKQLAEIVKGLRNEPPNVSSNGEPTPPTAALSSKWMDVEHRCRNAIVQVRSNMFEINWTEPFRSPETGEGVGSGFIFNEDGSVLTNFHVVGNSLRIQLQLPCLGKERIGAEVIGVSPERDIALLKINAAGLEKIKATLGYIPVLEFGSSDLVNRGTEVLAMGYPLAKDHVKSTQGMISGWEKVRFGERDFGQICLETTAPINPGNSGGPSIGLDGKVIGVNFAGVTGAQNVGYIIPIDDIHKPIQDLYTTKLLRKITLGVRPQITNSVLNKYLHNPENGGLYVTKVIGDSIAEKAGLKEGDVIYQINDYIIDNFGEVQVPWNEDRVHFTDLLNRFSEGEKIKLLIYRNGARKVLTITLEDAAKQPKIRIMFPGFEAVDYEVFGGVVFMEFVMNHLSLAEKNPKLLNLLDSEKRDAGAVVVTSVLQTSHAHSLRGVIAPGFVVEAVNGNKISCLADLRKQIKDSLGAEYLRLKSGENECAVLDVAAVLQDETRLVKIFQFDEKHSMSLKTALEQTGTDALATVAGA